MRYLSVCSGIEAASVAWHGLEWTPVAFAEIEPFPAAVLAYHYPTIPNLGDITQYENWNLGAVELIVGGTPCQSFSVAGLRKGLADPRGNLMLTFLAIVKCYRPQWVVWENVPGVLSSNGGRDFGTFLGALGELGYGWAYRVLDAQWFGVAQRRRRVFVVGCLGDWRLAATILFERESVCRNPAPSREKRQEVAGTFTARASSGGGFSTDFEAAGGLIPEVVGILSDGAHNGGGLNGQDAYSGRILPWRCQPASIAFHHNAQASQLPTDSRDTSISDALTISQQAAVAIMQSIQVRRLTPVECERLQGFPDDYTNIPWRKKDEAPDGPRYKALGNSMAVPVMRWIGERIAKANI